jgi:hypothetical protein
MTTSRIPNVGKDNLFAIIEPSLSEVSTSTRYAHSTDFEVLLFDKGIRIDQFSICVLNNYMDESLEERVTRAIEEQISTRY